MANLLNEKEQLIELEKLFSEEKYPEALELAELLKKEFTSSFQINLMYAKILRASGDLEKAEAILNEMLTSQPDNLSLLLEAAALSVDLTKIDQAREYYNKVLFIDSFNTQAKEALEKLEAGSEEPTLEVKQPEEAKAEAKAEVKAEAKEEGEEDVIEEVREEIKEKVEDIIKEEVKEILKQEVKVTEPDTDTEKKPWRDDTLPEEELDKIENLISDSDSKTEGEEVEITEDSIQLEDESMQIQEKPSIPGVDDAFVSTPGDDVEEVSTEAVEDFFMEAEKESKIEEVSTEKAPESDVSPPPGPPAEGEDFITESAAELYLSQGLFEESLFVYEKLYQNKKDEKYIDIIEDLKVKCIGQKKIQALTAFLELIQRRSE